MSLATSLIVWRESVCAGDDCDAPHELKLHLSSEVPLRHFAKQIVEARYLAHIEGGSATWILNGNRPLAVFAQQWEQPLFLLPPATPIGAVIAADSIPHFRFRYFCQVDPHQVFTCLEQGTPLPDMYD